MHKFVQIASLCAVFGLSACGGGGGSSGGSTGGGGQVVTKTPTEIITDAKSYSKSQLTTAAKKQADSQYSGSTSKADIDLATVQQVYRVMFDDNMLDIPEIGEQDIDGSVGADGTINATLDCDQGGSVKYSGKFDENGVGKLSMNFQNCLSYYNNFSISGLAAISVDSVSDSRMDYSMYFVNLNWSQDSQVTLSGVMTFSDSYSIQTGITTSVSDQYITAKIGNDTYLVDASMRTNDDYYDTLLTMEGRLSVASKGYVDFSWDASDTEDSPVYDSIIELNGGEARLIFAQGMVLYSQDTDGDGQLDSGRYLNDAYAFISGGILDTALSPLEDIALAPVVSEPYLDSWDEKPVSKAITVEPGFYYDLDTPSDELTVSYNWYINGALVEGVHGNTLPPYSVGVDQSLTVAMVVSDSIHTVESYQNYVYLKDTPAVLSVSDLPETVNAGDTLTFSVVMTDDDEPGESNLAALASAPDGATMTADGQITWTVPTKQLFRQQVYQFAFSNSLDPNNRTQDSIDVTVNADVSMPVFSAGIEVPSSNNSQWVADFDGDGKNELLGTDNSTRIFLLELVDGKYQQKWAYPYGLEGGEIVQVLPADMDQDGTPEILVFTRKTLWLIDDLNGVAKALLSSGDEIFVTASVSDVDADGKPELIYASQTEYDYVATVHFTEIDTGITWLMSFDVGNVRSMAIGNVDTDESMELVLDNGMVYDLTTGENQWLLGSGFGESFVSVGDLNGDGIEEIIGADGWGSMYVYSAVDKSQLATISLENTCDMHAYNLFDDNTDEIVVSDCQWGNVTAYRLNGSNQLETVWQIDLQDHGSSSLTMGDIDNDGTPEILWGTGTSHSGANSLVTADYTASTVTVKENTGSVQLDSLVASGWANIASNEERAVFFVPSTQNGYQGSVIVTMQPNGVYEVSEEISTNWDHSTYSATADFNKDGIGEIFVPYTDFYSGAFAAIQLDDMSVQYSLDGGNNSTIGKILAMDVNGDGFDDAVIQDGKTIKLIDINNQVLVASYTNPDWISDFDLKVINGIVTMVIADDESNVQLLTLGTSAFAVQSDFDTNCGYVAFTEVGGETQVACFAENKLQLLSTTENVLANFSTQELPLAVVDMVIDPTNQSKLLLVTEEGEGWYKRFTAIHSLSATGQILWSSPILNGVARPGSLKARQSASGDLEILLGTSAGMYWIH